VVILQKKHAKKMLAGGSVKISQNCAKNYQDASWLAGCPWNP